MNDDAGKAGLSIEDIKRRLREEAAAELQRKLAKVEQFERLAVELGVPLSEIGDLLMSRAPAATPEAPTPGPKPVSASDFSTPFVTMSDVIRVYRTHPELPYHALRPNTKKNYDLELNRLDDQVGGVDLSDVDAQAIKFLYDDWCGDGKIKIATGHALITRLRGLFSFGLTQFNDAQCQRLSLILNKMRFKMPLARDVRMTAEQAATICAKAHESERPSIGLAQAFQYECSLTQKDVIGEWVPVGDPIEFDVLDEVRGLKWVRGLRWEEIDDNLILRHVNSFDGKMNEIDLKQKPLVMVELNKIEKKRRGPVVIAEWTRKPWAAADYRRWWRNIANTAGVPSAIKNMDSRERKTRLYPKQTEKAERPNTALVMDEAAPLFREGGSSRRH